MALRGREFLKKNDGVTAIEFAIVAPVFFLLLFFTVEYCVYFFKRSMVHHVLYETARTIQTGEIQLSDTPWTDFVDTYCTESMAIVDCSLISFDVRAYASLDSINLPKAQFDDNGRPLNFVFQPGSGEQITVMRASIPHQFITPIMQDIFQKDGKPVIIVGYSVSKNEPFS